MNRLLFDHILLAQQGPLENIAREFQGRQTRLESGYLTSGLLILTVIVAALWLLSKVLDRYEGGRALNSSVLLFLSLCRAHRLRWPEWWLLWRVALGQQLKDPARLFLEPGRLDPASLPPVLRLQGARLESIRQRLFGQVPGIDVPQHEPAGSDPDGRLRTREPTGAPSSVPPVAGGTVSGVAVWPPDGPPLQDPSSTTSL